MPGGCRVDAGWTGANGGQTESRWDVTLSANFVDAPGKDFFFKMEAGEGTSVL